MRAFTGAGPGADASVPQTGQTTSYDTGNDGDQKGVTWPNPRFTDNGDGTVTDNLTHLIWDKNANRFGTQTWANALDSCNNLSDNGGDLTDDSVAGDWYLSNLFALESLRHMGVFNPSVPDTAGTGQWTSGDPFVNVQSSFYWSSTTLGSHTSDAWVVGFIDGDVLLGGKDGGVHVWCVRGGP